jgi:hypothetical protein
MPSLLAITDNGSGRAACEPACWASYRCLYKCQIPAFEVGPLLACLIHSGICAVESTWSSCLPLGEDRHLRAGIPRAMGASLVRCTKPFSIVPVWACRRRAQCTLRAALGINLHKRLGEQREAEGEGRYRQYGQLL